MAVPNSARIWLSLIAPLPRVAHRRRRVAARISVSVPRLGAFRAGSGLSAAIAGAACINLGSVVMVHHFSTESVDKSVGILFNRVGTAVLAAIVTDWLKIKQMIKVFIKQCDTALNSSVHCK